MEQKLKAVYRAGTFILQDPFDAPDETEVELIVKGPLLLPPQVTDRLERTRLLEVITQRMQQNPIPASAARLTRDELHERR